MLPSIEQVQLELHEAKQTIENYEDDTANAKVLFDNIKENEKNILATLMSNSGESAVSKAEMVARSSEKWDEFIGGLEEARSNYLIANAKLKALYAQVDINRTLLSYNKHSVL